MSPETWRPTARAVGSWAVRWAAPLRTAVRLATLLALCAGILPTLSWAACTKVQPGWLWNYEGHIAGQHRVRMTLVFGPSEITGVYFYASQLKDIALRGRMLDETRVVLEELDTAGQPTARFEAEFLETAPWSKFGASLLQCEVIRGTWRKIGADTALPVLLEMDGGTAGSMKSRYGAIGVRDQEALHRNAQAFWRAVQRDDRVTAARLIRYPIRVDTTAGLRRYTAAEQLLADYERIFTPGFRQAIARGLPRNMFVRDQGAMLGDGQVWFGADGRVTALNTALSVPIGGSSAASATSATSPAGNAAVAGVATLKTSAPQASAPQAASDDPPQLAALHKGMPPDVSDFIRRAVVCNHWAGEEPYDEDRRAQISGAVQSLRCRALDADQAALSRQYAGQPEVLRRLKRARTTPL